MPSTKQQTSSTFHALISSIFNWHFRADWALPDACSLPLLVVLLLLDALKPTVDDDVVSWLFVVVTFGGDVACCCRCGCCCCCVVTVSLDVGDNFIRLASGGVLDELRSSGDAPLWLLSMLVALLLPPLVVVVGLLYGVCVTDDAAAIGGAGGERVESWCSAWRFVRAGKGLKPLKFGICVDVDGKLPRLGRGFMLFSGDDVVESLSKFCISASLAARACNQETTTLLHSISSNV